MIPRKAPPGQRAPARREDPRGGSGGTIVAPRPDAPAAGRPQDAGTGRTKRDGRNDERNDRRGDGRGDRK